ncbi:MAG: hypothetical protein FWH37_07125 [Candidatus Bathyarchaeota archaeon]|nr:hypothetical protein [Candidatus Termiticorpusculum sp.]
MRKLNRPAEPTALTAYNAHSSKSLSVKKTRNDIRKKLGEMSFNKCAYCENVCTTIEIEHYRCQKNCPDKVWLWTNLLPSCHDCNTKKGGGVTNSHECDFKSTHKCSVETKIINPADEFPQKHLKYNDGGVFGKTPLGQNTCKYLGMRDTSRVANEYVAAKKTVNSTFASVFTMFKVYHESCSNNMLEPLLRREVNKFIDGLIMYTCNHAPYSAIYASEIFRHTKYPKLVDECERFDQLYKKRLLNKISQLDTQVKNAALNLSDSEINDFVKIVDKCWVETDSTCKYKKGCHLRQH